MTTTWDPSNKGTLITLSNGNLTADRGATGVNWNCVQGTTSQSSGKWYFEIVNTQIPGSGGANIQMGFCVTGENFNSFLSAAGVDDGWVRSDMSSFGGAGTGSVSYTAGNVPYTTASAGDVIGFALDLTAKKAWVSHNNTFGGTPSSGTNPAWTWTSADVMFPAWGGNTDTMTPDAQGTLHTSTANQTYSAPSGFTAWDGASATVAFRRTLSPIGTRVGSRQTQAWGD